MDQVRRLHRPHSPARGRTKDFYSYVLNYTGLAPAATATQSFSIDTDSDFVMSKMEQQTDIALAAITESTYPIPLVTVQITDGGSSRQLFSQAVPVGSVFGSGERPFILPGTRMFSAASTVTVTLVNYSAATTYNIRLVFTGIKHYRF